MAVCTPGAVPGIQHISSPPHMLSTEEQQRMYLGTALPPQPTTLNTVAVEELLSTEELRGGNTSVGVQEPATLNTVAVEELQRILLEVLHPQPTTYSPNQMTGTAPSPEPAQTTGNTDGTNLQF